MIFEAYIANGLDDVTRVGRPRGITTFSTNRGEGYEICDKENGVEYELGLRFINATIPKGALINSAYIEFTARTIKNNTVANMYLAGDNISDSGRIGTYTDFDNRVNTRLTTSKPNWLNIAGWGTVDAKYVTVDISSVISEITSLSSWASGNALTIFVLYLNSSDSAWRNGYSYEQAPLKSAKLVVDYSLAPAQSFIPMTIWYT